MSNAFLYSWQKILIGISAALLSLSDIQAQQYCTPRYSGSQSLSPFFTYIQEAHLSNLDQVLTPANASNGNAYRDFSNKDTVKLAQTGNYELVLKVGNGANTQTLSAWLDYNQNMAFEPSERIFTKTDNANQGNHIHKFRFKVPKNASTGHGRLRIGTMYGTDTPAPCRNHQYLAFYQNFHDYTVNIKKPALQRILTISPFDAGVSSFPSGVQDQKVLGTKIITNPEGILNPLKLDSLSFDAKGSDRLKSLTKASLYFTKHRTDLKGNTYTDKSNKTKGSFPLHSGKSLSPGNNFTWLTYDISKSAILNNRINARNLSLKAGRSYTPNPIDPIPYKTIDYCITKGVKNNYVYIDSFGIHQLSNRTGVNQGGYAHYNTLQDTLWKGKKYEIGVNVGNGANPASVSAWLDFNTNGKFDLPGEKILDTFFNPTNSSIIKDTITIPKNFQIGKTRLRVSTQYNNASSNTVLKPSPCTDPLDFGEAEDYTIYLNDSSAVVANFQDTSICKGDSFYFRENAFVTTGNDSITSYKWHFGDGDTSALANPVHYYDTAGFYKVKLIANGSGGGMDSITKTVRVENLKADFSANGKVSKSNTYFLNNTSNGRIESTTWYFRDSFKQGNDTSRKLNATYQYDSAATYPVKLVSISHSGCRDSITKPITIQQHKQPDAYYRLTKDTFYQGEVVTLIDESSNNTSRIWQVQPGNFQFNPGSDSTSQKTRLAFKATGSFSISLIAKNPIGQDTLKKQVYVKKPQVPNIFISASDTVAQAGQPVSFTDKTLGNPQSWHWYFGDGDSSFQQHPTHIYEDTGVYNVKLIATNSSGSDTLVKSNWIRVNDQFKLCKQGIIRSNRFNGRLSDDGGPNANYSPNQSCAFTINPPCPEKIRFIFDTFDVSTSDKLRIFDGQTDTAQAIHPGSGFDNNNPPPDTVTTFSGALHIVWETDNQFNGAGFHAKWESNNNPKPQPAIQKDSPAYVSSPVNFKGVANGIRNSFEWDFDNDGQIDATGNKGLKHKYTDSGKYTVRLVVSNCQGSDTVFKQVNVRIPAKPPEVHFKVFNRSPLIYDNVRLYDSSAYGPTQWRWKIKPKKASNPGNVGFPFNYAYLKGTSESSQDPLVSFLHPGSYEVCLEATNQVGSDTLCKKNYLRVLEELNVCKTDTTTSKNGILYDQGGKDGEYDGGLNNKGGDSALCSLLIDPCVANLFLVNKEFQVQKGDFLRVYDGKDTTGKPLFDDSTNGFNTANPMPDTLMAKTGSFYFEFETANGSKNGRKGFVLEWFNERIKPKISGPKEVCAGDTISLIDNSQVASNAAGSNKWTFKNQSVSNKDTIQVSYQNTGRKTVTLIVSGKQGCEADTLTRTIMVHPNPKPAFSMPAMICAEDTLKAVDSSVITQGRITTQQWEIKDSVFSRDTLLQEKLDSPGTYPIKMTVESDQGCRAAINKLLKVHEIPKPGYVATNQCKQGPVTLTDATKSTDSIVSMEWQYRGKVIDDSSTINVSFSSPAQLTVQVKAKDKYGCIGTKKQPLTYNPGFGVDFKVGDSCVETPLPVKNLTDTGITGVEDYEWKWKRKSFKGYTPQIIPQNSGKKQLTLLARSKAGCTDSVKKAFYVSPKPDLTYYAPRSACKNSEIRLLHKTSINQGSVRKVNWYFDNRIISAPAQKRFYTKFPEAGKQEFRVVATSDKGCLKSATDSIRVYNLPDAGFDFAVLGTATHFRADNQNLVSYKWQLPDTAKTGITANYQFSGNGNYPVSLTVTDSNQCQNTYRDTVKIKGVGLLNSGEDGIEIYPNPVQKGVYIVFEEAWIQDSRQVKLKTLTGKVLKTRKVDEGEQDFYLPLNQYTPGSYLLMIFENGKPIFKELIIKP